MAVSRTAEYVALFRAIETGCPRDKRLFSDPYAAAFLGSGLKPVATVAKIPGVRRLLPLIIDNRYPGARPSAVVRTGMIDDSVIEGLKGGAEQMAILGAGYDSRAMRLEPAHDVPVFELDQTETQDRKKAALLAAGEPLPRNVTYVPFDLEDEGVGGPLARAGFIPGLKTVCIWEGVLSYLTEEAVEATLKWFTDICGPGSRLIFTYVDVALFSLEGEAGADVPWSAQVAKVGEPFRYGLDPSKLDQFLADRGMKLKWDLSTAEALGSDSAPDFYRVAMAEIEDR